VADPHREARDDAIRIRAFFAIALDAPARRAAGRLARLLRDQPGGDRVRWVREENLHVTLRFLGDIGVTAVPGLLREVGRETAGVAPFAVRLDGVRLFPSSRRPRVVALEVVPPEPVVALAAAVERGVLAAGMAPEDRPFRSHLTLGRLRPGAAPPDVTVPDTPDTETLRVTEAVLFQSELHRSGTRYTPIGRVPFGAAR
jgi:2'-5' RNA ligase